jgi:hypothetical protein
VTHPHPQHVTLEGLVEWLGPEIAALGEGELKWWSAHSVTPFPARYHGGAHFVVAIDGQRAIFFADDEDEFGIGTLVAEDRSISDYGLVGDLKDAVRVVAGMRSNTSLERTRDR